MVGAAPVPLALGLAESTVSIQPQRCLLGRFRCAFFVATGGHRGVLLPYYSRGLTLAEIRVGTSGYFFPDWVGTGSVISE
ncbi:MAG: hypothetical protein NZ651_05250 [Candidatus Bipolaricaulota bacterium]|nr:hypothetical protein [Candidatus Bipolaricaulota bacterium]MDW8127159.1 hypothetical protein [Candidatus Bipolaricaulota bacterium]